ncbi:uncharacterized protein EAE98_006290 [Botrytis deweyae]|uniref:Uncharacterized protein n=1 Tax=Botrytis deweyae TaxID=2478750 RepID=A0ABQ7IKP6_9HELO|nr:uncharacterized protein EAE98_006290 [Botrytis deweyae]KAF7926906.1 hypothetical protein EAE98_006290 [Botrytis deweyae]
MGSNKRPSRNRKMPERLNSPSVQIETSTHSQNIANTSSTPPPTTPTYASSSSPSSAASTPTPAIRTSGNEWRKTVRATLPTRAEVEDMPEEDNSASSNPMVSVQRALPVEQLAPMPVRTPADEYDINSPYYGLNHTPEWDDLGIDVDDPTQERWFPALMLFHELTKAMSFKGLVSYLDLTDLQLINFAEVYESETQRDKLERKLTLTAMQRLDVIRRTEDRLITVEDFELALLEEVDTKLPETVLASPIPLLDIGNAIAFLQTCYGSQMSRKPSHNGILSLSKVNEVINEMRKYTKLGVTFDFDFTHELGFREYIESETDLAGGGEGMGLSGHEAEQSAQQPIGRPKKRGKQFPNKPLRNKSDLLKMVLPSKLQQMESVEDEAGKEAEGKAVDKGKGKGKML